MIRTTLILGIVVSLVCAAADAQPRPADRGPRGEQRREARRGRDRGDGNAELQSAIQDIMKDPAKARILVGVVRMLNDRDGRGPRRNMRHDDQDRSRQMQRPQWRGHHRQMEGRGRGMGMMKRGKMQAGCGGGECPMMQQRGRGERKMDGKGPHGDMRWRHRDNGDQPHRMQGRKQRDDKRPDASAEGIPQQLRKLNAALKQKDAALQKLEKRLERIERRLGEQRERSERPQKRQRERDGKQEQRREHRRDKSNREDSRRDTPTEQMELTDETGETSENIARLLSLAEMMITQLQEEAPAQP